MTAIPSHTGVASTPRVRDLDRQLQAAVAASGTTLTDIHGLGSIARATRAMIGP